MPTAEQFAADVYDGIHGGIDPLSDGGADEVQLLVDGDEVTFRVDGGTPVTRVVVERRRVRDREGSGPFKGTKEVLALGVEPLVRADLTSRLAGHGRQSGRPLWCSKAACCYRLNPSR